MSSSNEEHEKALQKADVVASWLSEMGFPEPVKADSGNGAHLLYRIDLPNNDESTALMKRCLEVLDALFSDHLLSVDTANFNAGRIWKLYGTVSLEGDNTTDRSHRQSRIISTPHTVEVVGTDLLQRLATRIPMTPPDMKDEKNGLVLTRWVRQLMEIADRDLATAR